MLFPKFRGAPNAVDTFHFKTVTPSTSSTQRFVLRGNVKPVDLPSPQTQQGRIFNWFIDMVRIASPSGKEDRIRQYLQARLLEFGLQGRENLGPADIASLPKNKGYFTVDPTGNLIVVFPGNIRYRRSGGKSAGQSPVDLLSMPKVVNMAHLDTVNPCLDDIMPIVTKNKKGELYAIAPKGSVLGADDKAALAAMLEHIRQTALNPSAPRPTQVYVASVHEEDTIEGATKLDRDWLKDAHLVVGFDHDGRPGDKIYYQAPSCTLRTMDFHPPASLHRPPVPQARKQYVINVEGEGAHAGSAIEHGKSATMTLLNGLGEFLDASRLNDFEGFGLHSEILSLQGGVAPPKSVAAHAQAIVELSGPSLEAVEISARTLQAFLDSADQQAGTHSLLSGQVPEHYAASNPTVNAFIVDTLRRVPHGLNTLDMTTFNLGHFEPLPDGGVRASFDLRGTRQQINDNLALVDRLVEQGRPGFPGITYQTDDFTPAPELSTDLTTPSIALILGKFAEGFEKTVETLRARGLSDLNAVGDTLSTVFATLGVTIPAFEVACGYSKHHKEGNGKGDGENVKISDMPRMVDIMNFSANALAYTPLQLSKQYSQFLPSPQQGAMASFQ